MRPIIGDAFEIKGDYHPEYEPGVVAVLAACRPAGFECLVGRLVRIRAVDGVEFEARVDGIKDHRTTVSLYFKGRRKGDVPIGATIELPSGIESGFATVSATR